MSIAYPIANNQIIYVPLQFPYGGVCEIENASPFYAYISLGLRGSGSDIISQQVATIPPYQRRAFRENLQSLSPYLSIFGTNQPFAFVGTINNSQAVIRITEYGDPKAYLPAGQAFEGLAADYVIVAGGRIQLNQFGEFITDAASKAAFALVGQGSGPLWDGSNLNQGDFVIGPYFSSNAGIYWDAQNQLLNIKGGVIIGGQARSVASVGGTWTPTGQNTFSWAGVVVNLTNGQQFTVTDGSFNLANPSYLFIDINGGASQTLQQTNILGTVNYPLRLVAFWNPAGVATEKGSIHVVSGLTVLGSGSLFVSQLSSITADVGALTAGTITGVLIRTAASGARVQMQGNDIQRFISTTDTALDGWYDPSSRLACKIFGNASPSGSGTPGAAMNLYTMGQNETGYISQQLIGVRPWPQDGSTDSHWQFVHAKGTPDTGYNRMFLVGRQVERVDFDGTNVTHSFGASAGDTQKTVIDTDVKPGGDNAGVLQRTGVWRSFTDHFTSFTAWTWDNVFFNGAPTSINTTLYSSCVRFQNGTAGQNHFAYKPATSPTTIQALLFKDTLCYVGLRIDDGGNGNFVEWRLADSATTPFYQIQRRARENNGAITLTTLIDLLEPGQIWLAFLFKQTAQNDLHYYSTRSPIATFLSNVTPAFAWTVNRAGIIFGVTSANQTAGFDAFTGV